MCVSFSTIFSLYCVYGMMWYGILFEDRNFLNVCFFFFSIIFPRRSFSKERNLKKKTNISTATIYRSLPQNFNNPRRRVQNTGRDKIVRFHGSVWYETRASILVDNCFIIAVSGEGIITRVAPQLTETTDMQERSQRVVIFAGITASPPQPSFVNLLGSL